ncbi:MAG: protein archease [Acidobacteriota bacterium]
MGHVFFDHTGDVAVSLEAETAAGLFREAARALTEILTDFAQVRAAVPHPVQLTAASLDELMIEWLSELLYRFEVQKVLVAEAEVELAESAEGWTLEAVVHGDSFDPLRHHIKVLVKGITYHRLNIVRDARAWKTDVVFDI